MSSNIQFNIVQTNIVDLPDNVRKCALCGGEEPPSKLKMIISPTAVDIYLKMDDFDLIQLNHRLPKMKTENQGGKVLERGNCAMTYHKKCWVDYVCT